MNMQDFRLLLMHFVFSKDPCDSSTAKMLIHTTNKLIIRMKMLKKSEIYIVVVDDIRTTSSTLVHANYFNLPPSQSILR